jgi:hypothetical protein
MRPLPTMLSATFRSSLAFEVVVIIRSCLIREVTIFRSIAHRCSPSLPSLLNPIRFRILCSLCSASLLLCFSGSNSTSTRGCTQGRVPGFCGRHGRECSVLLCAVPSVHWRWEKAAKPQPSKRTPVIFSVRLLCNRKLHTDKVRTPHFRNRCGADSRKQRQYQNLAVRTAEGRSQEVQEAGESIQQAEQQKTQTHRTSDGRLCRIPHGLTQFRRA